MVQAPEAGGRFMNHRNGDLALGQALIVVPTYNERPNLAPLAQSFFSTAGNAELLVVDDASPDGTAVLARELQAQYPRLKVIERRGPRGLGHAYLAGLEFALEGKYSIVGTMDADFSHDPKYLPQMFAAIADADVVIGSRYIRDGGTINWRLRRIVLSWLANLFAAKLLRIPAHDLTSGFRLYRSEVLHRVDLKRMTSTGYSFLVEMLFHIHQKGARIREVPIIYFDRSLGESKLGRREIYRGAYHLIRMRWNHR
jgi:dolichol-phosphate mannosyltransferase